MLINASGISAQRGTQLIWQDLDLSVTSGDAVHVIGANGAGKSTLLLALARAIPITGTLSITTDYVAFLGHQDGLKPQLTGRENLAFWAQLYGHAPNTDAAEQLGILAILDREVARYSAGQRRKLALARLAQAQAKIWLLDEPMINLDREAQNMATRMMRAFTKTGGALVFSTHGDAPIKATQTIDVSAFKPKIDSANDPFLEVIA